MYTLQSPSSIIHQNMPNFYHCRTPSHSRLVPNPSMLENRPPSQKKLSITCTMKNPNQKEVLRKRSGEISEIKGKFVSMQTSFMRESVKDIKESSLEMNEQMREYARVVEQRLETLKSNYALSLHEMNTKIEELEAKLATNQRELRRRSGQIEQLEILCRNQQNKIAQLCHPQQLQTKIDDLSIQLRIMGQHCEEMQEEHSQKYDKLAIKTIGYFGNKIANLRQQSSDFVRKGLIALQEAEQRLTQLQVEREKGSSQGTRGSMQSVGESILNLTQSQQADQGVSFWDDCFFHPPSENCELIMEMAKRRGEPLRCWIDQFNYLRYCDSSSYIYNRKGDRVKLSSEELGTLLEQNLLAL